MSVPEVQDYNYAITINENNIINNVNQENLQIKITFEESIKENTSLKLVAFDESGRKLSISGLPAIVTPEQNSDKNEMKVQASQNKIDVTKDEKTHQDIIGGYPHISDGTIYFRLFDAEDEKCETPLGETKVTKNTVEPTVAKVSAERSNTDNATFKATRYGESDVTTIYYCAVADNNLKPEKDVVEWNPILKKFSAKATEASFKPETREINVDSNSIEEVINGLSNTNGYKIYYIVENSYGSQTLTAGMSLPSVDVAKDTNTPKEEQVKNINLPTSDGGDFTWDNPHNTTKKNNGYVVTLYKDGEIYHEEVVSDIKFQLRNYSNPTSALEAGEYYIEVVTKGNVGRIESNATIDSDVIKSDPVTVKAVNPVSNIQLSVDESNGYPKLSWDENDANCAGYKLNLYVEDAETGVFSQTPNTVCTTSVENNKSIYFATAKDQDKYTYGDNWRVTGLKGSLGENSTPATLNRNNGYYAEVVATPDSEKMKEEDKNSTEENIIYVNSQPTYYYFCAPYRDASITDASDNTMTFKLDTTHTNYPYNGATCAYGEEESDLTYAVRVYKKVDESNYQDMGTTEVTTTYDKDENGNITATYFTVSGLEAYTEYQFRLITKCGEFEGWSDVIANGHTMPRVNGLTCTETDSNCTADANNFYSTTTGATVKIEGKEFKTSDFTDDGLRNEFINLKAFLSKLKNGDKVTINGDVIDLELNKDKANSEADASFMYADYLEGKTLNITGSDFERKIGKPKTNEKYPAEVNLKAGQFDLSNFQMNKDEVVTLGNGVKIKTGYTELGNFIVAEGSEITVNNVKMKTDIQTAIKTKTVSANGVELTVVANGEESNNLVFENLNNSVDGTQNDGNVTIKFVSSNGTATTQQGSITIKGKGGKVTVTQENVTVGSDIEVTVEKGEVDVSGDKLTGGKTVTLSGKNDNNTAKITAVVEKDVPSVLKGKTVEIKQYESVEALKTALSKNTAEGAEITEEVLAEVNSFLASFGVNSENVKVTLNGTNNIVTIENDGTNAVEIQGLK